MADQGANDLLTDAELVDRVGAGDDQAFDELYRRHADGAWRMAQAVTGNAHDAADAVAEAFARVLPALREGRLERSGAFRSYLYSAARNAGLDTLRRGARTTATDDGDLAGLPSQSPSPADMLDGAEDAAHLATAFRALPERWRSVLWLTEVEGVATKDAAELLGLTANGTAQLALRARAGLRERYLQASDEQLEDVGPSLRRIALPLRPVVATIAANRAHAGLSAGTTWAAPVAPHASTALSRVTRLASEPTPMAERALAGTAAGLFAIGVVAASFLGRGGDDAVADEAHAATLRPAAVSAAADNPRSSSTFPASHRTVVVPSAKTPSVRVKAPARVSTRASAPAITKRTNPVTGAVPAPVQSTVGPVVDPITALLTPVTDALNGDGGNSSAPDAVNTVTSTVQSVLSQVPAAAPVTDKLGS
jgi:RNA polymerase sigma factor (sigma-70 family)